MAVLSETAAARLRRSSNVVSRVVANEAIVVPIRRGVADLNSIYTFNESGTLLWSWMEKGLNPAELVSHLQSEYGLSREQAAADAESFLKELNEEGLVEPA
jgi:hypothetical protein